MAQKLFPLQRMQQAINVSNFFTELFVLYLISDKIHCFHSKFCPPFSIFSVDIYSSNEGDIYCKPHFRELFKPKAVVEDSPEPSK